MKPGLGSPKVIKYDTIHSGTHDFLLTFHSNYRPISHSFRDIRRFPSKIANFSRLCAFNAPAEGIPLGIGYRHRGQKKLEWWGYQVVGAVFIQYWRVTDRHQLASHLARVKTGFWPSYCQISTNQVKFCTRLLLYGMHLWAGLDRDRRMGGSIRPNRNDCVFVILVTHPESYIETTHDGSPRFRWQTVRVEVRTGAVVKKFRNFVAWAELDPKSKNSIFRVFFDYPAHSLTVLSQTNGTDGKPRLWRCAFC